MDINKLSFLLSEDPYIFSNTNNYPHYTPSDIILIATISPEDATDTTIVWTSSNTDIATVSNAGKVILNTALVGTTIITAKAGNQATTCEITVSDVFSKGSVTINNVVWATRNVNAPGDFVENPEDIGMVYQWNRKRGWSSENPMIANDGSTTWDSSYYKPYTEKDPDYWTSANDPSPIGWRVPTYAELLKLLEVPRKWTRINGVKGLKFGSDENSIFLPTNGYWRSESGTLVCTTSDMGGDCGKYWSGSPHVDGYYYTNSARALSFIESGSGYHHDTQAYFRAAGLHIRSVAK